MHLRLHIIPACLLLGALAFSAYSNVYAGQYKAAGPYSFVCFDQWQNSTRRPRIVQHTLKDGGVFVLKYQDGSTSFYMQKHGEDCYIEEAAQKRAHTKKVK